MAPARITKIDGTKMVDGLHRGEVAVVAGFQGLHAPSNRVTTLGRGGSDTSAVALAAAIRADRCDIYTDVDGVYTTDPRVVPKARRLDKVSFEEMLEMASLGAKVLQVRSVEVAMVHKVKLYVRSSFDDPADPRLGTLICDEEDIVEQQIVTGIAFSRDESQITLREVADKPGVAAAIFGPLADANINVDMIIQVVSEDFGQDRHHLHRLRRRFRAGQGDHRIAARQGRLRPPQRNAGCRENLGHRRRHALAFGRRRARILRARRQGDQHPGDHDVGDQVLDADRRALYRACGADAALALRAGREIAAARLSTPVASMGQADRTGPDGTWPSFRAAIRSERIEAVACRGALTHSPEGPADQLCWERAMDICVVGAGSIGGLIAAKLAEAGENVSVVARGPHLRAIRERGLVLKEDGRETVTRPRATDRMAEVGQPDLVVLGVKAHQLAAIAADVASILSPQTMVLTAQNGIPWWYFFRHGGPFDGVRLKSVDPDGAIAGRLPIDSIIASVVYPAAEIESPGVIRHIEGYRLSLAEIDGAKTDRVASLSRVFTNAGFKSPVVSDVRAEIWTKLWGNLAFNPISALSHATLEEMCRFPPTRALVAAMMQEAQSVAETFGVRFRISVEKRIAGAEGVGAHKTSMLQDVEQGRAIEIEAILGSVIELGRLAKVATPHLDAIYAAAKLLAKSVARTGGRLALTSA